MSCDLVVLGNVVTPTGVLAPGAVAIADGRIAEVLPEANAPEAQQVRDHRGSWILPGAIDGHVHCFSSPQEGFTNATLAAAAGGVTTIVEMPYDAVHPRQATSRTNVESTLMLHGTEEC